MCFVAQHNQYLEEWRKDDVTFVYTRAARNAISSIKTNNCLVVTGSSGTGKSFIVHHIALHLFKKDGYEIIPFVTGPSDIIQYYDPDKKQVFVVDDICGKESINSHIVGLWKFYSLQLEKIFPHLGNFKAQNICQGTKLVISCRLQIFKDKLFRNIQLFTRNACNLSLSDMCLLPQERSLMIQQYLPKEMINYVENILGNFDFFPLLCCLSRGKTSEELVKLFSSPIDIITNDVNSIYLNNKFQFCALVLCVLFQKGFNVTWIKSKSMPAENKFQIYEIVKELSIDLNIDSFRKSLVEGFTTLEDTYLKKRGTSYRIIHDKVHTFISVICSEHLTSCFLRYAPSSFVRDHFRFKCYQTEYTDNSVALETEMEEEYFDRLLDDLKNGEMRSIFYNRLLLFTSFRNKLLDYFERNEEAMFFFKYNNSQVFNVAKSVEYNYYSNFTHTWIEAAFVGFIDVFKFLIDIEWNQIQSHIRISTLYAACRNGNVDIVSLLLNGNTNIAHNTVTTVHLAAAHTLLLVACIEGHQAVVHILLNSITDLSQFIRKDIKSSLHNACEDINTDLENLFNISTGLDFRRLCVHGRSPLYMACYKGHFDITRMLLNKGADTSILCDSSLFAKACKEGYTDILKILIANDRSINNLNGNTLLVEASKRGHTETVQVLLDSNTEMFQFYDFSIRLPLFIACQKGLTDIVRLLLKYSLRFSCFQCNSYGRVPPDISEEVEYKDIENMTSEYNTHAKLYGYTYLFIGGYGKEENKLSFKIESGYFNKYTKLLLQMACYIGHIGTVKVLLENGFDVNQCNSYGISSLYAACVKGHTNIVNLLLDENADVFRCDKFGKSPLFVACENGHADTVKLLLEHNAEISPCGRSKKSPFFVACEKGYGDIVRILLKSNVDVFQCDRYGRSPFYVACKGGHAEIVNILLSNNAILPYHNKYGKSAMCVACEEGHLHIVNLLLKNNFDFYHSVYNKLSLIITALGRGHIDIANILVQYNDVRCECDGFQRAPCYVVCEIDNYRITKLLTNLREEYSTQRACDTNTVEILFYSHYPEEYELLHLYVPRLRLYTEIFNHFLKSEQQNENKTNNQE